MQRFPSGGPSGPGEFRSDPHEMQMGMLDAARQLKARALVSTADASAGTLIDPAYVGLLAGGLVRPPKLRDLLTRIPVASDHVEYVREASRVAAAAPVAEATATTGASGLKPEGGVTFAKVTEAIRTIGCGFPQPHA